MAFTREEANEWRTWMKDPKGTVPHRDTGSRSRPVSIGSPPDDLDELIERMVARGVLSPGIKTGHIASTISAPSRGSKREDKGNAPGGSRNNSKQDVKGPRPPHARAKVMGRAPGKK